MKINFPTKATVTAVFHNPYNTPIGLYSDANVFDAFSHQTKGIINPELAGKTIKKPQDTPHLQTAPRPQKYQPQLDNQPPQPRGSSSLSMRMLDSALTESEGTPSRFNY